MKTFFEEYGITLLVSFTGIIIIGMLIGILNNSPLVESVFVLGNSSNQTGLGVQDTADDESIKTQKLKPVLITHDIIVEYGSTFDEKMYFGDSCTENCFQAYVELDGVKQDLSDYVTVRTEDGDPVDTTITGEHTLEYQLSWNSEFVTNTVRLFVMEDPNAPDVDDEDILNNYVRGVLKDVDGNGVEAHLQLRAATEDGTALVFNAQSGSSGSFIIYGIKPGITYELYVVGYEGTPISTFLYEGGAYNIGLVGVS